MQLFFNGILASCIIFVGTTSTSYADMRSEVSLEYSAFSFNRHDNDFISDSEASKWDNPNVSAYIANDFNATHSYALSGKYVEYSTDGIAADEIEDDSPKNDLTVELSLMHKFSNDSIAAFGINYADMSVTQEEADSHKIIKGYNISFANDYDKLTYALTIGKIYSASQEEQDALTKAKYAGVVLDYAYSDQMNFGVSYDYLVGDEYDQSTRKSEQTGKVASIYGAYRIGTHTIKAGYKYSEMIREDVEGSNIGETQGVNGNGFFVSYSIPFGKISSKKERLLIMQKPNLTEFAIIGGSIMD